MMAVEYCKVDAKFKKENGTTQRRETKIFLNENKKDYCIGIVLMLNPGKCLPSNENGIDENWQEFENIDQTYTLRRILKIRR